MEQVEKVDNKSGETYFEEITKIGSEMLLGTLLDSYKYRNNHFHPKGYDDMIIQRLVKNKQIKTLVGRIISATSPGKERDILLARTILLCAHRKLFTGTKRAISHISTPEIQEEFTTRFNNIRQ